MVISRSLPLWGPGRLNWCTRDRVHMKGSYSGKGRVSAFIVPFKKRFLF